MLHALENTLPPFSKHIAKIRPSSEADPPSPTFGGDDPIERLEALLHRVGGLALPPDERQQARHLPRLPRELRAGLPGLGAAVTGQQLHHQHRELGPLVLAGQHRRVRQVEGRDGVGEGKVDAVVAEQSWRKERKGRRDSTSNSRSFV